MATYQVVTGSLFSVLADSDQDAIAKLAEYLQARDCSCGRPQWGEEAAAEGDDLCDCVEPIEPTTQILKVED